MGSDGEYEAAGDVVGLEALVGFGGFDERHFLDV
ncbi:MAG: hypothetical protein QOF88_458, partial [Mycobacterium sp.]|nr:hypothetical protein [Mycobacterium sp.]MDT5285569.1 hypothetical protein [Mycobacterium sp.]